MRSKVWLQDMDIRLVTHYDELSCHLFQEQVLSHSKFMVHHMNLILFQGIREDALNIILNLKRARFHVIGDEPQTITLVATKPGVVTAGEFTTGGFAEVLTPDQPIAEITDKNGRLEIDITLARGLGLISRENLVKEKTEVGHIVMDAVFTPIIKANI
jgi:DNA-directed RNA polymerase alpha subunit